MRRQMSLRHGSSRPVGNNSNRTTAANMNEWPELKSREEFASVHLWV
jgi:hypothetical protein